MYLCVQENICEVQTALRESGLPFGAKASEPQPLDFYGFKHDPTDYNVYWDVRKGRIPIVGGARETGECFVCRVPALASACQLKCEHPCHVQSVEVVDHQSRSGVAVCALFWSAAPRLRNCYAVHAVQVCCLRHCNMCAIPWNLHLPLCTMQSPKPLDVFDKLSFHPIHTREPLL